MQAQQALLNAEIDQHVKAWKGTQSYRIPCKSNGISDGEQRPSGASVAAVARSSKSKRLTLTEKTAQEAVSPDEARVFRLIRW